MSGSNIVFPVAYFAFIAILTSAGPSLVYAQENPFHIGSDANPFEVGSSSATASGNSNTTLQIRSNTDWSGTYGDSTGSTTVDGHGNKDFSFSCSNTYSADFQKKGEGPGFLRLNIVQPFNNTVTKVQETTRHGVPLVVGGSINLAKQITDLHDGLDFLVSPESNSSSNALDTNQPFNTTLRATITDPDGSIIISNDTGDQSQGLSPTPIYPPLKPHITGKYTFTVKNIGDSLVDVGITYGSLSSQTTITTHNVTNTQTTSAQFGTVSVSGNC
jgi:hypothetical protein